MHKKELLIIFASNNPHKYKEVKKILSPIPLLQMTDIKISSTPIENGESFLKNAHIKALNCYKQCRKSDILSNKTYVILAEDSGICVNALNGEPGIHSSRYGYEKEKHKGSSEKNSLFQCKLLLKNVNNAIKKNPSKNRTAHFICCAVLFISEKKFFINQTHWDGEIIKDEPSKKNGFGYDPIFFIPEKKCTSAELSLTEKNSISHRAKAFHFIKHILSDIIKA